MLTPKFVHLRKGSSFLSSLSLFLILNPDPLYRNENRKEKIREQEMRSSKIKMSTSGIPEKEKGINVGKKYEKKKSNKTYNLGVSLLWGEDVKDGN